MFNNICAFKGGRLHERRHANRETRAGGGAPESASPRAAPARGRAPHVHRAGASPRGDPPEDPLPREGPRAGRGPPEGGGAPRPRDPGGLLPGDGALVLARGEPRGADRRTAACAGPDESRLPPRACRGASDRRGPPGGDGARDELARLLGPDPSREARGANGLSHRRPERDPVDCQEVRRRRSTPTQGRSQYVSPRLRLLSTTRGTDLNGGH